MNAQDVLNELEAMGGGRYRKMMMKNYGVRAPCFGVKIGDMKTIQKRIKMDYQLALDLYETGNYDAMYLAGLIADDARMTKKDLRRWLSKAYIGALAGYTVAWVAAESRYGWDLALEWIESSDELTAVAGWATLSSIVSITTDAELNMPHLKELITRIGKVIHQAPDMVRYEMNGFIIAAGSFVESLTELAFQTGKAIGPIKANLGSNTCQIRYSPDYIEKVQRRGAIGKKRKSAKC